MKQALIALAVVCSFALLFANQPIRDLQGPAGTGGGGNSTPVDVMNFPTDEDGNLSVVVPVVSRVMDMLDQDVPLASGETWTSDAFSADAFNWIAIQTTVSQSGPSTTCEVQWRIDEVFWLNSSNANNSPQLVSVKAHSIHTGTSPNRTALAQVQAPLARVRCFGSNANGVVLSDVKVLLRRE